MSELAFNGDTWGVIEMESRAEQAQGYRKEAERYAELASSGQRDISNFVHKRLAERLGMRNASRSVAPQPAGGQALVWN